ncbi:hypothetical protein B566_EDAN017688 [Ephemera danica]|nr:hypothetical protein B566_EDAN017688 [Ephemera danica]
MWGSAESLLPFLVTVIHAVRVVDVNNFVVHPKVRPAIAVSHSTQFNEVFAWKQIDFAYPSYQSRQDALRSGLFDPLAVVPIGVAAAGPRLFLSMPRWKSGIPAALATIPLFTNTTSPRLQPYPNWSWHRPGNCDGITSVFRVKVDECGRLWVLDTGAVNTFVKFEQICPPQVHVFDLHTDRLIHRYRFPEEAYKQESLFTSIEVEYPDSHCGGSLGPSGAIIYVTDTTMFALVVADLRLQGSSSAWRVQDKTMYPTPEAGSFVVAGESFELMDGVLSIALSPRNNKLERLLFYHAMSSFRQRWVPTRILHNSTAVEDNPQFFKSSVYKRSGQASAGSMDQHGVLFFGLVTSDTLACWNTFKPFVPENVVSLAQDPRALQFVTTTTVDQDSRVWALSTRFQKYILETLDPNEVNFRVVLAPSSEGLVRGTNCEHTPPLGPSSHHVQHVHHHLYDRLENQLNFLP